METYPGRSHRISAGTVKPTWSGNAMRRNGSGSGLLGGVAVASAYGWGSVPMMSLYDAETNLPVIGWNKTIE